jgi:cyclic pyranopterin phosphate synthase
MGYEIINGKVQTRALEYHIVDHCNLHCDQCCSFSPFLKSWFVDPVQFEKDLIEVSKYVQPTFLKIVGGEPLLHPQLLQLLKIARRTGVAPKVSITTNGHLLTKMPDELWENFEMLTVSIYPFPELPKDTLHFTKKKAKAHNISVSWKVQDKFVNMNRTTKSDYKTAKETFEGCWIHHRCNSVKDGRFYSCTRPQYIQRFAKNPEKFKEDGVDLLNNPPHLLPDMIKAHLESTEPINSCYLCLGGNATLGVHKQLDGRLIAEGRRTLAGITGEI